MIPVARPGAAYESNRAEIDRAIAEVLENGSYVLGDQVEAFQAAFAEYCGVSHGVGVNSGTDAITLALRALNFGPGDRVITVSHTALATVAGIVATGATPVLIDIDPRTYTMDPALLKDAISERVKAVLPVHLYGNTADVRAISDIAKQWDLAVVEDCAQAAGAGVDGRRAGSLGDLGCFSFYPTKNLGALGDGGMIVTNDQTIADSATRLRQYGWDEQRVAHQIGINSRLDELQAAILLSKLSHLDAANARRAEIADRYSQAFATLPLAIPSVPAGVTHAWHLYVVATPKRSALRAALQEQGIQTAVHYPLPAHRHPGYADAVELPSEGVPVTERAADEVLTLPLYPEMTDAEVDRVITAVVSCAAQLG